MSSSLSLSLAATEREVTPSKTCSGSGQRLRNPVRLLLQLMFESGDGLAPLSPRGGRGEEGVGLETRLLPPAPEAPRAGGAGSSVPGARARRVRGAGAAGRGRGGRRGPGRAGPVARRQLLQRSGARGPAGDSEQAGGRQRRPGRGQEEDPAKEGSACPRSSLVPTHWLHPRGAREATSFWGRS